jgi:hypothetical protein
MFTLVRTTLIVSAIIVTPLVSRIRITEKGRMGEWVNGRRGEGEKGRRGEGVEIGN